MSPMRKVRVATDDDVCSVAAVRAQVSAAVGQAPRVDLQELERDEVVLELALEPVALPGSPADLRRALARACPNLEVLSAWDEEPDDAVARSERGAEPPRVLRDADIVAVPVALRALLDDVPTAGWLPFERAWTLAVPRPAGTGRRAVAVATRRGYGRRFPASAARRVAGAPVPA